MNVIETQVKFMNGPYIFVACGVSDSSVWVVNISVITLAIPIINYCLYPFLREYTPNMRKKIGIGHILTFLSPLVFLILSSVGFTNLVNVGFGEAATNSCMFNPLPSDIKNPISSVYILIPHILISLAEIFVIVSSKL